MIIALIILYVLGLVCFYIPLGYVLNKKGYFIYYDPSWRCNDSCFVSYMVGSIVWPFVLLGMGSYFLMGKYFLKDKN